MPCICHPYCFDSIYFLVYFGFLLGFLFREAKDSNVIIAKRIFFFFPLGFLRPHPSVKSRKVN